MPSGVPESRPDGATAPVVDAGEATEGTPLMAEASGKPVSHREAARRARREAEGNIDCQCGWVPAILGLVGALLAAALIYGEVRHQATGLCKPGADPDSGSKTITKYDGIIIT